MTAVLGVVGTGMIGTSIALRARELGCRTLGYDADQAHARAAQAHGALDEIAPSPQALYARADIGVLAMHLEGTLAEIARLRALREEGSRLPGLVIDVASVKVPVAEAADNLAPFVATHPMAGRERSGPQAADASIFAGRVWAYVPSPDAESTRRARELIEALGARPFAVDAAEHDAVAARTSHLPQLVAWLFADALQRRDDAEAVDALCGPTARELLRLSRSSDAMWRDIFRANRLAVSREARSLAAALEHAAQRLEAGDDLRLPR